MILRIPHPRFLLFVLLFLLATLAAGTRLGPEIGLALGFDAAVLGFMAASLPLWRDDHPAKSRQRAARDDGGRLLLLMVSGIVLAVVLGALVQLIRGGSAQTPAQFLIVVITLVLAWLFVNLVFAFHYAHLYYDQVAGADVGGLDFPGDAPPTFADFCYFSYVLGMTCQVSDVTIRASPLRRVALLHGLFAFFFNLGVLALSVNILSGVL